MLKLIEDCIYLVSVQAPKYSRTRQTIRTTSVQVCALVWQGITVSSASCSFWHSHLEIKDHVGSALLLTALT